MENHEYLTLLGEKIRGIRKNLGIKQEKLASDIGISRAMIIRIESGTTDSTISRLRDIANALMVEFQDLVIL